MVIGAEKTKRRIQVEVNLILFITANNPKHLEVSITGNRYIKEHAKSKTVKKFSHKPEEANTDSRLGLNRTLGKPNVCVALWLKRKGVYKGEQCV